MAPAASLRAGPGSHAARYALAPSRARAEGHHAWVRSCAARARPAGAGADPVRPNATNLRPTPRRSAAPSPESPLERARIHTELGAGYYEIGKLGIALQELNEAIEADPKYAPAYNTLAWCTWR